MEQIDVKWMKRFQEKIDKLDRFSSKTNDSRCQKEIFVCRYFKFLNGKCFKIKLKDEVFFAMFNKSTTTTISAKDSHKYIYNSYGITFSLGYGNSEYDFTFRDEKFKVQDFTLGWNDILKVKWKEITMEEYIKVIKMFLFEEKLEII